MLAFKFFAFIGMIVFLTDSIKSVKQDNTTKNKISVAISAVLLLFGIFMLYDAFM